MDLSGDEPPFLTCSRWNQRSLTAYTESFVRRIINPSDMAGVAISGWPITFVDSNSNFGPARTTNTSPSSLEK